MVKAVKGLEAELGSHTIGELPILFKSSVPILVMRTANVREEARHVAEAAIRREGEGPGVEPLVRSGVREFRIGNQDGSRIAAVGGLIVAKYADGDSLFEGCDAGDLPSADDCISSAAHA